MSFLELVDRRFVVSSLTFASVALTGGTEMDPETSKARPDRPSNDDRLLRAGRPLEWGDDLRPGDLLEDRGQYIVLLADDGDGMLGRRAIG